MNSVCVYVKVRGTWSYAYLYGEAKRIYDTRVIAHIPHDVESRMVI